VDELEVDILDLDEGRWCLVIRRTDDATFELFETRGLQGGGYTWQAIANALIALRAPELAALVEVDAEAEEMSAYAHERAPLEALKALLVSAAANHELLEVAMAHAGDDLE